jgi:hypothetical protein
MAVIALQSEIWLIKSRINPFPVKGEMALDDGKVGVTVTGGADCVAAIRDHLEERSRPALLVWPIA